MLRRATDVCLRMRSGPPAHTVFQPVPWVRRFAKRLPPKPPKAAPPPPRHNEQVKSVKKLLLICDKGTQLGVLGASEALGISKERGLHLLEVRKDADPPVWRLVDELSFLAPAIPERVDRDAAKKAKKEKRTKEPKEKEVRLTDKTEGNDLDHKVKLAQAFLKKGKVVKAAVLNTGRVEGDISRAEHMVLKIVDGCAEFGKAGPISGAKDARIDESTDPNNPLLGVVFAYIKPLAEPESG